MSGAASSSHSRRRSREHTRRSPRPVRRARGRWPTQRLRGCPRHRLQRSASSTPARRDVPFMQSGERLTATEHIEESADYSCVSGQQHEPPFEHWRLWRGTDVDRDEQQRDSREQKPIATLRLPTSCPPVLVSVLALRHGPPLSLLHAPSEVTQKMSASCDLSKPRWAAAVLGGHFRI